MVSWSACICASDGVEVVVKAVNGTSPRMQQQRKEGALEGRSRLCTKRNNEYKSVTLEKEITSFDIIIVIFNHKSGWDFKTTLAPKKFYICPKKVQKLQDCKGGNVLKIFASSILEYLHKQKPWAVFGAFGGLLLKITAAVICDFSRLHLPSRCAEYGNETAATFLLYAC